MISVESMSLLQKFISHYIIIILYVPSEGHCEQLEHNFSSSLSIGLFQSYKHLGQAIEKIYNNTQDKKKSN